MSKKTNYACIIPLVGVAEVLESGNSEEKPFTDLDACIIPLVGVAEVLESGNSEKKPLAVFEIKDRVKVLIH